MKITKVVWFDETERRLPELVRHENSDYNSDTENNSEATIEYCSHKPEYNGKRIRITIEELF